MKLTDRDTKMTGTVEDLISDMRVAGVRLCIKRCVRENECASVNFKVAVTLLEKNCELLKISKSTNVDGLTSSSGWMHYEPVSQVCFSFVYFTLILCYVVHWIYVMKVPGSNLCCCRHV